MKHLHMLHCLIVLPLYLLLSSRSMPVFAQPISTSRILSYDVLNAVSCSSISNCWAVGFYRPTQHSIRVLIEHWDGARWSVVPGVIPSKSSYSVLWGVSCLTAGSCWAVGDYTNGSGLSLPLAELWNGSAWSVVPTAQPASEGSELSGVSCASATNCVAVGDYLDLSHTDWTLAEHWNGIQWSLALPPRTGTTDALWAVSCPDARLCIATGGSSSRAGTEVTLIERWNGTAWSVLVSPNPLASMVSVLFGVSCASASTCMAVGRYNTSYLAPPLTLAERWNGARWSVVYSPNLPGTTDDGLGAVSCSSVSACTAVGSAVSPSAVVTLAERWNGAKWTLMVTPNAPGPLSAFGGVACASASMCVAVGDHDNGLGSRFPLAESCNGTRWTIVPVPIPHSD